MDLNHVDKAIRQLGARYEPRFTADVSVLVAPSVSVIRKQKLDMALLWKVPIVKAEWLWMCITVGYKCPFEDFLFPELGQHVLFEKPPASKGSEVAGKEKAEEKQPKTSKIGKVDEDLLPKPAAAVAAVSKSRSRVDASDFTSALREKRRSLAAESKKTKATPALATALEESHDSYETAPSQRQPSTANTAPGKKKSAAANVPLADISNLSQPPSSSKQKHNQQPARKPLGRIRGEIADSEEDSAGDDEDLPLPVEDDLPVLDKKPAGKRHQSKSPSKLKALEEEPAIEDPGETAEELRRRLLKEAEEKKKVEKLKVTDRLVDLLLDAEGEAASIETAAAAPATSFASALSHSHSHGGGGRSSSITAAAVEVAADARTVGMSRTTRASSEAASIQYSDDGSVTAGAGGKAPRRRKREILGRAMSNVSSTASQEGVAAADAPPPPSSPLDPSKSEAKPRGTSTTSTTTSKSKSKTSRSRHPPHHHQQKETATSTSPTPAPATTTTSTTKRQTRASGSSSSSNKKDDNKDGPAPTQVVYQDGDSRKARQKLLSMLGDESMLGDGSLLGDEEATEESKTGATSASMSRRKAGAGEDQKSMSRSIGELGVVGREEGEEEEEHGGGSPAPAGLGRTTRAGALEKGEKGYGGRRATRRSRGV